MSHYVERSPFRSLRQLAQRSLQRGHETVAVFLEVLVRFTLLGIKLQDAALVEAGASRQFLDRGTDVVEEALHALVVAAYARQPGANRLVLREFVGDDF